MPSDRVQFSFQREPVHGRERQAEEKADPAIQKAKVLAERLLNVLARFLHGSRIRDR